MGKNVHTVYHDGKGWGNKAEGNSQVSKYYNTKDEAVTDGRNQAKNSKSEHLVHNMDGKIAYRNSYGNDPYPPKG